MLIFGLVFVGAFLLQGMFGFFQIKNFSKNYGELRRHGSRVLIGKNPKRFQSGTLMLLAIDEQGKIKRAKMMKGVTVFAKFKNVSSLEEKYLAIIATDYASLHEYDNLTRRCIQNAYKNYVDFQAGKLDSSQFDTSVNVFSMPMFVKLKSYSLKFKEKIERKKVTD